MSKLRNKNVPFLESFSDPEDRRKAEEKIARLEDKTAKMRKSLGEATFKELQPGKLHERISNLEAKLDKLIELKGESNGASIERPRTKRRYTRRKKFGETGGIGSGSSEPVQASDPGEV